MHVFLTGATGAIGRFAVPALIAAGHQVTAIGRTGEKARWLAERGARPVDVSIFDRRALAAVLPGHGAVLNLATHIPPVRNAMRLSAWAENNRIRDEGSTALSDAALAAGVGRFVQESVVFLYADQEDRWIDESAPVVWSPITASVATAEANAARITAAGGIGVVLRFGLFYGAGSEQTEALVGAAKRHIAIALGRPGRYLSSIHLADAAAAAVAALDIAAGIYNVVDDEPMRNRELGRALGAAIGKRPWLRLPGRLARLGGERVEMLLRSQRVSNARLRGASSWRPRYPSVREGFRIDQMEARARSRPPA